MSVLFEVDKFFESSGNAAANFSEQLRDGVATFACGLWSNYPDFITRGTNPANGFARGFMNSMCSAVQPAVPPPQPPFPGGQCTDAYTIDVEFNRIPDGGGAPIFTTGIIVTNRLGPIGSITPSLSPDERTLITDVVYDGGLQSGQFNFGPLAGATIDLNSVSYNTLNQNNPADPCGDLPSAYNSPDPQSGDLNTTINITLNDGLSLPVEIQHIQLGNTYNFPMAFEVNGNNTTLDIGGLHFHAPSGFSNPSGSNDVPPPGSEESDDGTGTPITKTYPDNEYVVADDFVVPREIDYIIEYLVCNDGLIETITNTVKMVSGVNPILVKIIDILGQILTDVCEETEVIVGLPEYYGLSPGADRSAIVYLWKEYINNTWQRSTYSSTVSRPSPAAIANIQNLTSIEKTIGTYKTFIRLTDGSVIKATGNTPTNSIANFNFLFDQVDASWHPDNVAASILSEQDSRLQVKTLKLRQIEYYPDGQQGNITPIIRRALNP